MNNPALSASGVFAAATFPMPYSFINLVMPN
jgi:hypothetical protein